MTASSKLGSEGTMGHGVGGRIWCLREDGRLIFVGLGLMEVDVCLAGTREVWKLPRAERLVGQQPITGHRFFEEFRSRFSSDQTLIRLSVEASKVDD